MHSTINIYESYFSNVDPKCNQHFLKRYLDFISSLPEDHQGENHHILPKSIWPAYIKSHWNLKRISFRSHFLCHQMLYKIFSGHEPRRDMAYALFLMKRGTKSSRVHAVAKVEAKKYISQNSKGKVVVKDCEGNTSKVSVTDPRYLNGELTTIFNGCTHSLEARKKISDANIGRVPVNKGVRGVSSDTSSKMKSAKNIKISYNGKIYDSFLQCSNQENIPKQTVSYRVNSHSEKFKTIFKVISS